MQKKLALLDRDGVINRERGNHTWLEHEFELLPASLKAVEALAQQEFKIGIITNQSGIGLNKYGRKEVLRLFDIVSESWKPLGVTEFLPLFCPHHPSKGRCLCRKPGSLLLERAMAHFNIEPSNTFFVGDRERDVEAGINAGAEGLLIEANTNLYEFLVKAGKLNE